jgi:hypothetical protein
LGKILFANGCSWTAGNGIPEDENFPKTSDDFSNLTLARSYTWPEYLGKKLNVNKTYNYAEGGGSNARIVRTTVDFLLKVPKEQYKNLIVVLGWTTADRNEIYLDSGHIPGWFRFNARQKFSDNYDATLIGGNIVKEIDQYQKIFLTHIYNHRVCINTYFHQKFMMSNMLENLGIKYLFVNSLPLNFVDGLPDDFDFYHSNLAKISKPAILAHESFSVFCDENKLKLSSCYHPMIDAHKKWADFLHNKLTDLYGENL